MKKSILILCVALTILSLTAYGYINMNDFETDQEKSFVNEDIPNEAEKNTKKEIFIDFIYDVGPRFGPIKKDLVDNAKTIDAFFDEEQIQAIFSLNSVSIIMIIDDKQSDIRETGNSFELTDAQIKLLQASNYSSSFLIRAEYQQKNKETGELEYSYSTPHLTIVPEKQATYVNGKDELKKYLKENSEESRVNVDPDKLKPAKLYFTVTKEGTIKNIKLDRSSGYPEVDKKMIELISKAPGKWLPAENIKGEKVEQELVVSFGLMGC